jgi:hypothetical protein
LVSHQAPAPVPAPETRHCRGTGISTPSTACWVGGEAPVGLSAGGFLAAAHRGPTRPMGQSQTDSCSWRDHRQRGRVRPSLSASQRPAATDRRTSPLRAATSTARGSTRSEKPFGRTGICRCRAGARDQRHAVGQAVDGSVGITRGRLLLELGVGFRGEHGFLGARPIGRQEGTMSW